MIFSTRMPLGCENNLMQIEIATMTGFDNDCR